MKKISFLLFVGFLSINILQCKGQDNENETKDNFNSKNNLKKVYNKDTIMLYNILQEQLKYGHPQYDDFYTPYDYSERDYTIILPYIKDILDRNGYKQISQDKFKEKIKIIFNRILDYNNSNNYIYVNFLNKCNTEVIFQQSDIIDAFGVYVNKNLRCISDFYAIPEILDYQNIEGIKQYERNLPSRQKTRDGREIQLDLWKDEENLSKRRNFNEQLLIHRNKYLFNDNKASLVWLKVNDTLFLESLVKTFGYMNDKDLLQWVIDRTLSQRANKGEDYNSLFFMKDCSHKFIFHKKTFEVLKENINKNYLDSLLYYFNNIKENRQFQALTFEQKAQILAHLMYIGEYFVEDDKYMDYRYRFMGPFYEHSGEGDKYDTEFIKNNYYNLPDFKQIWEQAKEEGDGIGLPM